MLINLASYKERTVRIDAMAKDEMSRDFFKNFLLDSMTGANESKTIEIS